MKLLHRLDRFLSRFSHLPLERARTQSKDSADPESSVSYEFERLEFLATYDPEEREWLEEQKALSRFATRKDSLFSGGGM